MFGRRFTLFRLLGFEVRIDSSWLVIAALITWSLAAAMFPSMAPGRSAGTYWWMAAAGAVGFFASIIIHELCHSLVANRFNLPMKGITLFIFGGVAEMSEEPRSAKVEFLMAIAGPLASIGLGFLFWGLWVAGEGNWRQEAVAVFMYLAWINWALAAFNLIPAFPLDGGRVLRSAIWHFSGDVRRATQIAARIGSGFGIVLMAFAFYQLYRGWLLGAVWYFLIGMFLRKASQASYQQVMLRDVLQGEPVSRFMRTDPVTVPSDISVRRLVEDYMYRYDFKMFPVVNQGAELAGCVTTRDVKSVPSGEWDRRSVLELMRPCSETNTVPPEADALKVLSKMQQTGASRLLVTDRNRLVAVVSLKDLMHFLAVKLDLEGRAGELPKVSGF